MIGRAVVSEDRYRYMIGRAEDRNPGRWSAARRKGKWVGGMRILGYDIDPPGGRTTPAGTLAVGDLIGDSRPEIFAITSSPGLLHAIDADGTVPSGWPFALGLSTSWAAPSIGDPDRDGDREVPVVGYNFGVSASVLALEGDGAVVPGFPVIQPSIQTYSCPVLGDVDDDGDRGMAKGVDGTGGDLGFLAAA